MIDLKNTQVMIDYYKSMRKPTSFLSGLFPTKKEFFSKTNSINFDVKKLQEFVAVPVYDYSQGYRVLSQDGFSNNQIEPPAYKEAFPIVSQDLLNRSYGENPFKSANFNARLIRLIFDGMSGLEDRLRRAIELQASQILQTGKLDLQDQDGEKVYEIDYKLPSDNKLVSATDWDQAGNNKMQDLKNLVEALRDTGKLDTDRFIMGEKSFELFLRDEEILKIFDNRSVNIGSLQLQSMQNSGAAYQGRISIGTYFVEIWTYNGKYQDPQTGDIKKYIDDGSVIALSDMTKLETHFAGVPNIGKILGLQNRMAIRSIPGLPDRIMDTQSPLDMHTNVFCSNDGESLMCGIASRPLLVPKSGDGYAVLNTGV